MRFTLNDKQLLGEHMLRRNQAHLIYFIFFRSSFIYKFWFYVDNICVHCVQSRIPVSKTL